MNWVVLVREVFKELAPVVAGEKRVVTSRTDTYGEISPIDWKLFSATLRRATTQSCGGLSEGTAAHVPGTLRDRGCQYASREYRNQLDAAGISASMSRIGNCYDNATMESFFATLKTEVFNPTTANSRRHAELMVFDYIETFYNVRRLHSRLGYKSPIEFETQQHHSPK